MVTNLVAKILVLTAKMFSKCSSGSRSIRFSLMKKYSKIKGPILIHNMAKVGSKTIVRSLKSFDPLIEVYQTHYLSQEGLIRAEEKMGKLPNGFWDHIDENRKIHRRVQFDSDVQKWQVISLVRDPVERDVSFFFHCLNYLYPSALQEFNSGQLTTEKLIELFLDNLYEDSPLHFVTPPLKWFESEMYPVFNIDVFAVPFPKEKGYFIYTGEKSRLLLIRLESLSFCAQEAFKLFLGIPKFKIKNENTSAQRFKNKGFQIYSLYHDFKTKIIFPRNYLDDVYNSRLVNHFYTQEEISFFKQKWRSG